VERYLGELSDDDLRRMTSGGWTVAVNTCLEAIVPADTAMARISDEMLADIKS
jgi:hypothetical protein